MDGVPPWKWTVSCHGDWVGHVISGSIGNHGEIKKVPNSRVGDNRKTSSQNLSFREHLFDLHCAQSQTTEYSLLNA